MHGSKRWSLSHGHAERNEHTFPHPQVEGIHGPEYLIVECEEHASARVYMALVMECLFCPSVRSDRLFASKLFTLKKCILQDSLEESQAMSVFLQLVKDVMLEFDSSKVNSMFEYATELNLCGCRYSSAKADFVGALIKEVAVDTTCEMHSASRTTSDGSSSACRIRLQAIFTSQLSYQKIALPARDM